MTRPLSEAAAWRKIARRIEKAQRSPGLCVEVIRLRQLGQVDWNTAEVMQARINGHKKPGQVYAFPSEEDTSRIFAAQFLALEAAEDRRRVA